MYLSVGLVFAIILVLASPIIWIVWWLLADLGEVANSARGVAGPSLRQQHYRRAA